MGDSAPDERRKEWMVARMFMLYQKKNLDIFHFLLIIC